MTNRRKFLQTTASISGSLVLPSCLFGQASKSFLFIHTETLETWSVADPVRWCLANRNNPILKRASAGLANLSTNDGDEIIRLVVRCCPINLLEVQSNQVTFDYWGQKFANLRPFFKSNGLARHDVEVVCNDQEWETVYKCSGDTFQYGDPLDIGFPLKLFVSKWERRFEQEVDDWMPAWGTRSGFVWDNLDDGFIPWGAMKSAWRSDRRLDRSSDRSGRSAPSICLNCDQPTLLINFGLNFVSRTKRSAFEVDVCRRCRKQFCINPVTEASEFIAQKLDTEWLPKYELFPKHERIWGKRVPLGKVLKS